MAPPPLPVNLRCHLPTNGCDRRPPELGERELLNPLLDSTDIYVLFVFFQNEISWKDTLRSFNARSAFNSARCGAEVAVLLEAALLNKVEQWVNPSTGEDNAPPQRYINTCVVLSTGTVGKHRELLRSFARKCDFYAQIKGWRAIPAANAHREAHDWYLHFKGSFLSTRVCLLSTQLLRPCSAKPDEKAEERGVVDLTWLSRWGIRGRWLELPNAPESQLSWLLSGSGRWPEADNAEKPGEIQLGPVHPHIQDECDHPVFTRCALWQQRPADVVGFPRLLHGHFLWGSLHNPPVENSQIPVDCVLPL